LSQEKGVDVQPEHSNKALPALQLMQELLGDKYVFDDDTTADSRNEEDLDAITKRSITLPMSATISNALLAALETTFGPKVVSADPKNTVKKPWPGPWAQKPKKQLYTQRIPPLLWTGKFFADSGLNLPHEHDTPKSMVTPRKAHTVPIAQIKQDTALVRETVLAELKIQQSETGYNELLNARSVTSTLSPGCSKKLEKILS
jgi:hypothetical protein